MTLIAWVEALAAMLTAGLVAGFVAGLFGIGGGFVVVPALFAVLPLLGASQTELVHVAIGTSLATIVATSMRSLHAHSERGAVDVDVLKSWAPWIVLGVGGGVVLASHVPGAGLAIIFGSGVLLMALHFLFPVLGHRKLATEMPGGAIRAGIAAGLGAFSSLLGIGGGTIAIIVMTLCGKPIHRAIGTASGFGVIIAIPGMVGFGIIGLGLHGRPYGSLGYVNLPAALVVMSTTLITAPWGVAAAHALSPARLKRIFGIYLLIIGSMMIRNGLNG